MKLPTNDDGDPVMGYFGADPVPGGLQRVERPDEDCFVCSVRLREGDAGVVMPYSGGESDLRDHVAAHLTCFRLLIRSEI
jgi:hypothetical protein